MKTIRFEDNKVIIIDQRRLPAEFRELVCADMDTLYTAIKELAVRGAPLLGVAGAYGILMASKQADCSDKDELIAELVKAGEYIKSSRPTAVNLAWAIDRVLNKAKGADNSDEVKKLIEAEAMEIADEDFNLCEDIGRHGAAIINDGDVILTHCNAGALATAGIGTALAPLYVAKRNGVRFKVYADETRPLLQGARLTAWELLHSGIDVTLICDNMAASLMRRGIVTKVITGADRIAVNGDVANKIGTYSVAVCAKYHNIPFYIAAPYSTFDKDCADGGDIPIEIRDGNELRFFNGKLIAPKNVSVYNPAFDVTPAELISGYITENGIIRKDDIKNFQGVK